MRRLTPTGYFRLTVKCFVVLFSVGIAEASDLEDHSALTLKQPVATSVDLLQPPPPPPPPKPQPKPKPKPCPLPPSGNPPTPKPDPCPKPPPPPPNAIL